jgi:hypothetical protein
MSPRHVSSADKKADNRRNSNLSYMKFMEIIDSTKNKRASDIGKATTNAHEKPA